MLKLLKDLGLLGSWNRFILFGPCFAFCMNEMFNSFNDCMLAFILKLLKL